MQSEYVRAEEHADHELGLFAVPETHRHLSVIEFSHRHQQTVLEDFKVQLTASIVDSMLDLPAVVARKTSPISLIRPSVAFDAAGVALCFVPAVVNSPAKTYHDLRNELQKLALSRPIQIDTCYTAATAHIAIARFIKEPFVSDESRKDGRSGAQKARMFLKILDEINADLRAQYWENLDWDLIEEHGLELQMGYLKFGRERELASLTGRSSQVS